MNDDRRLQFIHYNKPLFWYTPEDQLDQISDEFLVETILNYGDLDQVRELFDILTIQKVAKIFHKQTGEGMRSNYKPRTQYFFTHYFKAHA